MQPSVLSIQSFCKCKTALKIRILSNNFFKPIDQLFSIDGKK